MPKFLDKRFRALESLKNNWDGERSPAPPKKLLRLVGFFLANLEDQYVTDKKLHRMYATEGEAIVVEWKNSELAHEIFVSITLDEVYFYVMQSGEIVNENHGQNPWPIIQSVQEYLRSLF